MSRVLRAATLVILLSACASGPRPGELTSVTGASPELRPTIAGASHSGSLIGRPTITVSYTAPAQGYPTFLRVFTQASVSVLAAPDVSTQTGLTAVAPGTYRLALGDAPVFLRSNVRRDARNPGHEYVLVVLTSKPVSFDDLQQALDDVDLRGPDDEVLARVARAVGLHTGGAWGANAIQTGTVFGV